MSNFLFDHVDLFVRCDAYTLFLESHKDAKLAGQCYGRDFHESTDDKDVVGGAVAAADKGKILQISMKHEIYDIYRIHFNGHFAITILMGIFSEDTITVFEEINFGGPFTTITTNTNISSPVISRSIFITGIHSNIPNRFES